MLKMRNECGKVIEKGRNRGGKKHKKELNLRVKIDHGTVLVYRVRERAVRVVFLIIHI